MNKIVMVAAVSSLALASVANEGVYINSDAWNFWLNEKMGAMSRDELRRAIEKDVDFYATKGVKAVLYNMNIQRCFYPSKVATPFWKDVTFDAEGRMLLRGKRTDSDNATRGARRKSSSALRFRSMSTCW